MYFEESEDFTFTNPDKNIKVHKNGSPTTFFDLKVKKSYKPDIIIKTIIENLQLQPVQKFRLFTVEGVEIYPEELLYLKDGDALFASRGEEFDKNSTLAEYEIEGRLGEGGFGSVFLAVHRRSKEKVAIKFLKSANVQAYEVDRLYSEAETLKNLRHKNIVKILNFLTLPGNQVAFVMEYLEGGELLQYVLDNERLSEDEAREFFIQITQAVSYLHRQKIIHCDLKLENLLLESKETKFLKVVDFGISGLCSNIETGLDVGSFDYMAPEFFTETIKNLHPGVDVWAMGCILYAMVCGKLPFRGKDKKTKIAKICNAEFSYGDPGNALSPEIKDLISRMLQVDASKRLSSYEIFDHPWMKNQKMEERQSTLGEEFDNVLETPSLKDVVKLTPFKRQLKKANNRSSLTVLPTILPLQNSKSPKSSLLLGSNSHLTPSKQHQINLPRLISPGFSPKIDHSFLSPQYSSGPDSASKISPTSLTVLNAKSNVKSSSNKPKVSFSSLSKKYLNTRPN